MKYDPLVPGSFSETTLEFARHPNDEERAFQWMTSMRQRGIGLVEAKKQATSYLTERGAGEEHIIRQLRKVEEHFKPWLLD